MTRWALLAVGGVFVGGVVWMLMIPHESPPPSGPRPDILFISLDTLRRDALGAYGNAPSPTPSLDMLAQESVVFERAYVPMPFTLPSHMSMFTGLYHTAHGVERESRRLAENVVTMAEYLGDLGYATAGIHTNDWIDEKFGFGDGFDLYEQVPHQLTYADRVTDRALEQWDRMGSSGQPRFLFLHYLDAHSDFEWGGRNKLPYYSPPRYLADLDQAQIDSLLCDDQQRCATAFLLAADEEGKELSDATLGLLADLYARGVAYLDGEIGRLLDGLRQRGGFENTLLILLSDHGEEFREHGELIHSQLYDETSAIPLIIKFPGGTGKGRRIGGLVEVVDLLPTILDYLGSEPTHPLQGVSLIPMLHSDEPVREHGLGQDKLDRTRYAVFGKRYKLIVDRESGSVELYDLTTDAGEVRNLAAEEQEVVDRLRAVLGQLLEASKLLAGGLDAVSDTEGPILSEEQLKRLRALGYLR